MHVEQLVIMANDIANFFRSGGEPGASSDQVADHLRRYWDPRMRKQIIDHLEQGGSGLSDIARQAVALLERPGANTSAGGPAPSH
jgi:formate dehydrogenase subunit delta